MKARASALAGLFCYELMSALGRKLTLAAREQHCSAISSGMNIWPFLRLVGAYVPRMSIRCLIRIHRPMLNSIVWRENGYTAFCDSCGVPIERSKERRWAEAQPLLSRRDQAA